MNKTLIAAAAALVVISTAGGATAGTLITSKDIKNGTIKPADLTKPLRAQATSPTGFTTVTRVTSTTADTTAATCPADTTLIGGGGASTTNSAITASYPDGNTWHATPANFPEQFTTYALCAS